MVYSGTLEPFQGTHIQGASRGHLCGSSAFLLSKILAPNRQATSEGAWEGIEQTLCSWNVMLLIAVCV